MREVFYHVIFQAGYVRAKAFDGSGRPLGVSHGIMLLAGGVAIGGLLVLNLWI